MKIPDRIVGYLKYEETDYPFELDKENSRVCLYPPTIEEYNKMSSFRNIFQGFEKIKSKRHEWIPHRRIEGITVEGYQIVLEVDDDRSNYNGFISYRVRWYYIYSGVLKIDGFKITGKDIELFYNPERALKPSAEFNDNNTIKEFSVASQETKTDSCGKYQITDSLEVNLEVMAYSTMHFDTATNPIDATSIFLVKYLHPVDIDVLITSYAVAKRFFEYVAFRRNICFSSFETFSYDEQGRRDYTGALVVCQTDKEETHPKVKEYILSYEYLTDATAQLFAEIQQEKMGLQHVCDSIEDRTHYSVSRFIMDLAEFEREFRNIYGQESNRSREYLDVKSEVLKLISDYQERQQGKRKRYASELFKFVINRDGSFENNVVAALRDCKDIMEQFVSNKYDGSFEEEIEEIGSRMGVLRNGIAHGRLNLQLEAIHLSDIKIIEELIYAIRLKSIIDDNERIKKGIGKLFGERVQ